MGRVRRIHGNNPNGCEGALLIRYGGSGVDDARNPEDVDRGTGRPARRATRWDQLRAGYSRGLVDESVDRSCEGPSPWPTANTASWTRFGTPSFR